MALERDPLAIRFFNPEQLTPEVCNRALALSLIHIWIAVVGQEHRTVVHPQLTAPVGLEIADRVTRAVISPLPHERADVYKRQV